jgi:hypothetical protein
LFFDARKDLMNPATRSKALDELQEMGVRDLRVLMYWRDVAPDANARSRPSVDLRDAASYSWGAYDDVMAAAQERGMDVLLTLTLPGPRWAMRDRRDHLSYPDAARFGEFVEAVGRRYGEQVDVWAIGNEPNHPGFLRPQYRNGEAVAPRLYRRLYRAATQALDRTGNDGDTKLLGELLPRGERGERVTPLAFLRGVLCLDRRYRKLRRRRCGRLDVDGVSLHPYTPPAGPFFVSSNPDDVTIGSLSRLTSALDRAARAGVVRPSLPIWLTEFGVQSTPDRLVGVSVQDQLEYRAMAEWIAYKNPRVAAFSQYLLTDDDPVEGVPARKRYERFESGLRFATGQAKPSFAAFPLTISAERTSRGVTLWGIVRPAGGSTTAAILAKDPRRRFRVLKTVRTNRGGAFTTRVAYVPGRSYAVRWTDPQGRVRSSERAPVRVMARP